MFERENAFYEAHKVEFREKYLDKWLVIVGESLFGVFDTIKDAVVSAMRQYEPGEFMLHTPADDGMVIEVGPTGTGIFIDHRPGDEAESEGVMTFTEGEPLTFSHVRFFPPPLDENFYFE